jgi:DNA-binding MarR family transcriptional regulator
MDTGVYDCRFPGSFAPLLPAKPANNPLDNSRCNEYRQDMARLADEIRMNPALAQSGENAALSILRTAEVVMQRAMQVLRPFDLTATQYNVLRILRGSETRGLSCSQVAERMIHRDPDITRLLDRLESRGLIRRERDTEDRRVVVTYIAAPGLALLKKIDPEIQAHHQRQFEQFTEQELQELIQSLERVRET